MRNYGLSNCSIKSGDKFGALEYTGNKYKIKDRWEGEFKCDCGNVKTIRIDRVLKDCDGKYNKCTCNSARIRRSKNIDEMGQDYSYYLVYSKARHSGLHKISKKWPNGIKFDLTYLDIKNQYLKQGGKCFYTGEFLRLPMRLNDVYDSNISVDRIDSDKHYMPNNIVLTTKEINFFKSDKSHDRFIELCRTVSNYAKMAD